MKDPKFNRHFNRAMGKYYHTEKDLRSDMKKQGLEFKVGEFKKPEAPTYVRSEWAKGMHQDIIDRKGRPPGDRFIAELAKRGIDHKSYEKAMKLAKEQR